MIAGLSANELHGQPIIYVNHAATGANNGTTWADAWRNLQDALGHATGGTRIWVAGGTYHPGTSRSATFHLRNGVEIYGGFTGIEGPGTFDLSSRDFVAHETILDGRIGAETDADDIYHVVTGSDADASAVLDGFTIAGAHADGATALWQDVGGGLLNINGSPIIRHCLFLGNHAGWGGAVYNRGFGGLTLVNCRFIGNTASMDGGAIHSAGAGPDITTPIVINGLFSGNQSLGGDGGAVFNTIGSRMTVLNGTFSQNVAHGEGGGVYHEYGLMVLMNCILWGNRDRGPMDQSSQLGGGLPTVRYGCVQGLTGPLVGYKNIGADPSFVDAAGPDGLVGTVDDNLRLTAGSPGIDAGTNETPVDIGPVDLDGNPRIVNDPMTPDTGDPPTAPAIVDMGAYEYQEPCEVDADCDNGDPCTDDQCQWPAGRCLHVAIECDDGVFCNGLEICVEGECLAGTPPHCDDGVACTADACNEATGSCDHVADHSVCDDGLRCDGVETCDVINGCQAGVPLDCDDGVECTTDTCDEDSGSCMHVPVDAACDDGLYCNGAETCDVQSGCQPGMNPCAAPMVCDEATDTCVQCVGNADCDDGLFCNGEEACVTGVCTEGVSPCNEGDTCDELIDECHPPPQCQTHDDCGDGNPCTDDTCLDGNCGHTPNATPCDDGNACTTDDHCEGGVCAGTPIPGCGQPPPPPPPPPPQPSDADGDGIPDANDQCPSTPFAEAVDATGCSCSQLDDDGDGVNNCQDACPNDPVKTLPGLCGCGVPDSDSDNDGTADCRDACPGTPPGSLVGSDGCEADWPIGKTARRGRGDAVPGSDVDDATEEPDVGPDTPPGQQTDTDGDPADAPATDAPAYSPARRSCGTCGALGIVSWSLLVLGLFGLRHRPMGPRAGRRSPVAASGSSTRSRR